MPNDRLTFRQRDLVAALKAARAAGVPVRRIEVNRDGIVLIPGEPEPITETPKDDEDPEVRAFEEAVRRAKI
jgi:hypothetical protein